MEWILIAASFAGLFAAGYVVATGIVLLRAWVRDMRHLAPRHPDMALLTQVIAGRSRPNTSWRWYLAHQEVTAFPKACMAGLKKLVQFLGGLLLVTVIVGILVAISIWLFSGSHKLSIPGAIIIGALIIAWPNAYRK
jgi:hypothetical protein